MLFPLRRDFTASQSASLGSTLQFKLTREFWMEKMFVVVDVVTSGAIATSTADGLLGLVKNITLNVADGASNRDVVNISGRGLIEMAAMEVGNLDRGTLDAKDATSATTYRIVYPIYCCPATLADPIGSALLLPFPRYNQDPVLTVQIASQADVDEHTTPTFALTSCSVKVVLHKRQVDIKNFVPYDWEIKENTQAYAASGSGLEYVLPPTGHFLGLGIRGYTATTTRGNIMTSGGSFRIEILGNVLHRFTPLDIQDEDDMSTAFVTTSGDRFAGLYWLDFLSDRFADTLDMGSALDADIVAGTGAQVRLLQDLAGAYTVKYMHRKVFGNISALKLNK